MEHGVSACGAGHEVAAEKAEYGFRVVTFYTFYQSGGVQVA